MSAGFSGDFDEFVNDVRSGRHVGVSHAEIDDVLAAGARGGLEFIYLFKDIGRESFDSVEFFGFLRFA